MAIPVTPATAGITAIPDPKRSPQSYQAYVAKQAADAQQASLDKSNAQIQSSYQPILDFYAKQEQQTSQRYAQNAANMKNIFAALSGVGAADTTRINDQYASSLVKQQTDVKAREDAMRAALESGQKAALANSAELGNGPAMVSSPLETATQTSIGQMNTAQTNWEGLMGAQKLNALTDVTNRGAGYTQQELAANTQNEQNLQEALLSVQGQQAGIQGQIAQAKIARDQAIQNNEFDQAAALQKQIDAMDLQDLKNQGSLSVAQTAAAARLAAARTAAAASGAKAEKRPTFGNNVTGIMERIAYDYSPESAATLQSGFDVVLDPTIDPNYAINAKRSPQSTKVPTNANEAYTRWVKKNAADLAAMDAKTQVDIKATARQYFNSQKYTKPATATNQWSQLMPGVGG